MCVFSPTHASVCGCSWVQLCECGHSWPHSSEHCKHSRPHSHKCHGHLRPHVIVTVSIVGARGPTCTSNGCSWVCMCVHAFTPPTKPSLFSPPAPGHQRRKVGDSTTGLDDHFSQDYFPFPCRLLLLVNTKHNFCLLEGANLKQHMPSIFRKGRFTACGHSW